MAAAATHGAWRMTPRASVNQPPEVDSGSSRARRHRRGERKSMRLPSSLSIEGSTTSATRADDTATSRPPTANEYRMRCWKANREVMAALTVSELNKTVLPAVRSVTAIAVGTSAPSASSPRNRETISRL